MPETAAFIDKMREAFGVEMINKSIRDGLAGEGSFYASENGREIGSRPREIAGKSVNGHDQARALSCDGCRSFYLKPMSPDGKRTQRACRKYTHASQRCADWSAK